MTIARDKYSSIGEVGLLLYAPRQKGALFAVFVIDNKPDLVYIGIDAGGQSYESERATRPDLSRRSAN